MPTDGTYMWFGMWVPQNVNNFEEAHNFMKSLDTALLTDAVSGQKRADMLNGMPVFYFNATGKKDEELLEYYGMYLQIARDAVAVAIYIGNPETTILYGEELKKVMGSLRPVCPSQKLI